MKIDGVPGEYFAQCFLDADGTRTLCGCYHRTKTEAITAHPQRLYQFGTESTVSTNWVVIWPVEIMDGIAYVPSEEELADAR